MQGSQYRRSDGWVNDPLMGSLTAFMTNTISPVFGPQNIPFLSLVTVASGTGNNALAAVPTVNLPVPFMVKTLITGDVDWTLEAGIITGPGTQAPNDQATSQKTWVATS